MAFPARRACAPRASTSAYDEWTHVLPSGELDHPARLHLIDGAGRVREIYSSPSSTRSRRSSTSPRLNARGGEIYFCSIAS